MPPASLQAAGELRYRTLGRTGLKVTTMGFGCMITSDPSVIEKAADLGINYFDTARGYQGGNNERMVGAALKSRRKQVYISTKTHGADKQAALADLEKSLSEIGTDYVDIWCLHGRGSAAQITDDLIDAQQTAKQQGKIRFTGISTHSNQAEVIPGAVKTGKMDVVIAAYNFTMFKTLEPAFEAAQAAGIGVIAMKVMAGGFRKARPGTPLHGKLSREGAMAAALKWVLKNKNVGATIPSITDMDQLDENFKAMAAPLTEADEQLLARQLEYIAPLYCRMCDRCTGACPKGLPVADMLRYLTYAEGYGQFALGRENFLALPAEVTGVRCNLCASCAVTCPYGVRVAERLGRAQELFA
ncbi:MAG: aldo/keto reductase [Acidobacteriota bacterium]